MPSAAAVIGAWWVNSHTGKGAKSICVAEQSDKEFVIRQYIISYQRFFQLPENSKNHNQVKPSWSGPSDCLHMRRRLFRGDAIDTILKPSRAINTVTGH